MDTHNAWRPKGQRVMRKKSYQPEEYSCCICERVPKNSRGAWVAGGHEGMRIWGVPAQWSLPLEFTNSTLTRALITTYYNSFSSWAMLGCQQRLDIPPLPRNATSWKVRDLMAIMQPCFSKMDDVIFTVYIKHFSEQIHVK